MGTWLHCPSPVSAEVMSKAGFDFLVVDNQHCVTGFAESIELIRTVTSHGVPAIVRIAARDAAQVGRYLDAGATGIICPLINTPEDAAEFASSALYPPEGRRSFGPFRSRLIFDDTRPATANDRAFLLAMIETKEGLENVDQIAAVPGITGLFAGPNDLALSHGIAPQLDPTNPVALDLLARIAAAAKKSGKVAGIAVDGVDFAKKSSVLGFDWFICASDIKFMERNAKAAAQAMREGAMNGKK